MHDKMQRQADVWKTCNKIRAAVFRVGLNLWDWYRPLDPQLNSLISESKFVSVLAGPLKPVVGLTDAEIAQLADYFRAQDGRVLYHQLCQIIHGEDANARDKASADCLLEACPPPPEPECHKLDQWQARRLCCLLATIAERELPLQPYFQDYELVKTKASPMDANARDKASADCLLEACPPLPEPECHKLDQWQARRLCCLLASIAERELPLQPYFQDYELVRTKASPMDANAHDKASADCLLEACPPLPEPECHKLDQWQARRLCCLLATIAERELPLQPYFQDYELVRTKTSPMDANACDKASADCLLEACPPPPEPECHKLDQWQARRLCCLLATIAERELPLQPYFQDYELVAKNDGRMTFAHFARVLNYIGVLLSAEDFNLLVRRFIKDSYTIDYVDFIKAVEAVKKMGIAGLGPEYANPSAVLDTTLPKISRPEAEAGMSTAPLGETENFHPAMKPPRPSRDLVQIMLRVQQQVLQRRIRVSEFFRDFDPLNSGRVKPTEFQRAFDMCGLGAVVTPDEVLCIIRQYLDPNDHQRVCWRTFEDDCDQVFTIKELEKHPTVRPGGVKEVLSTLPPVGSLEERGGPSERALDAAQAALLRVKAACQERAIDLRPAFGDHDHANNGHVSRSEVRRVLARLGVLPTPAQVRALEIRYLDDIGFHYVKMLKEMEQRPEESSSISGPSVAPRVHQPKDESETNIVQILAKIKGKIVREGVRPLEFLRQFDPHRELVIPRSDFYRGLQTAGVSLTPVEMDTLMEVFCAPSRRRYVEYERFCDTIGEALTQSGLERAPLLEPVPHIPIADSPRNFLNFEERHIVSQALAKLAKFPDSISNIMEVFQDIDHERCGTLPRVSVDRALCQRNLLSLVSARERDVIYKAFGYQRGCGQEVNYRGLVNALDLVYAASKGQPC